MRARRSIPWIDRCVAYLARSKDSGLNLPSSETLDRIGEQTREMRDLLRASSDRSLPLDAIEQQVSSLEQRLGRLVDLPVGVPQPPHLDETMREVRALLDGFKPGVTMTALEARLDDLTSRIEQGLSAGAERSDRRTEPTRGGNPRQLADQTHRDVRRHPAPRGLGPRICRTAWARPVKPRPISNISRRRCARSRQKSTPPPETRIRAGCRPSKLS